MEDVYKDELLYLERQLKRYERENNTSMVNFTKKEITKVKKKIKYDPINSTKGAE